MDRLLRVRKRQKAKKPEFRRADAHRKKRLDDNWRRPRGLHNKARRHIKGKARVVHPGYGSPAGVRGMHPSGYTEVLIERPIDLDEVDASTTVVRIGGGVGWKKRLVIEERARERGIRILNSKTGEVSEEA